MKKIFFVFFVLIKTLTATSVTYTVSSLATTNTGTGTSGTLRYCITQANASTSTPHIIQFSVAGSINISGNALVLPTITRELTIDGSTAPGFTGSPVIIINGTGSTSITGLTVNAPNFQLYGVEIINFPFYGLQLSGDANDNFIIGASGKGNRISLNQYDGMYINQADNGIIQDNKIGTNFAGTACSPNLYRAINITGGANATQIINNHISCSDYYGIQINNSDNCIIKGNIIGPLLGSCTSNGYEGIYLDGGTENTIIGGTTGGEMNKIAGNLYYGIRVSGSTTINNVISANSLSCNAYGGINLASSGNANFAAPVISSANGTTVTGTSAANAIIQVYRSFDPAVFLCAGTPQAQGADYIGQTTANGAGNWSLTGTFNGWVTATARSATGNTSGFSPRINTGVAQVFTNVCQGVPLSVELLDFNAYCVENNHQLNFKWSTLSENTNWYFTLSSSEDGINYTPIQQIYGNGTSNEVKNYSVLIDIKKSTKNLHFKLSQTNFNGETTELKKLYFSVENCTTENDLLVYPTLAENSITIDWLNSSVENVSLKILDLSGKLVQEQLIHLNEKQEMSIGHLSSGMYLLTFSINGKIFTRKINKR